MRHAISALVLLLSGCALWPISEAECKVPSWQQRGYDDGYGGHPPQYLRLARECLRFGVGVSETDYFKGWQDGRFEWERLMGSMRKRGG
jgi:hypothetical protein